MNQVTVTFSGYVSQDVGVIIFVPTCNWEIIFNDSKNIILRKKSNEL